MSVSPEGDLLAIITTHTVHIALIFDEYEIDIGPLRLKSFELGQTEHREDGSTVISSLWHPLGVQGRCFVTVTDDAVVRLWELNRDDRSSFEASTLSIDLKKLANAKDAQDTLHASYYGYSNSFSPDAAYLEPTAASFGGLGRNGENPWSSMTLWIAMADGDLYALCPLLPSKFQAFTGLISSLSETLDAKSAEFEDDELYASYENEQQLRQQTSWIQSLELQEPYQPAGLSYDSSAVIYTRPPYPRPEPKLQGPFDIGLDEVEISDLFIRNVSVAEEPLRFETGEIIIDEDEDLDPLGLTVICLLTTAGALHIMLDLDGVEPRWLPAKTPQSTPKKMALATLNNSETSGNLLQLNSLQISKPTKQDDNSSGPLISPDIRSDYAFFITHTGGVSYVSLDTIIENLQGLLADPSGAGSNLRISVVLNGAKPKIEKIIEFDMKRGHPISKTVACVAVVDEDVGYLILTSTNGHPYAVTLDTRFQDQLNASIVSDATGHRQRNSVDLDQFAPMKIHRLYQPDTAFYQENKASKILKEFSSKATISLRQDAQISEETLTVLIEAHRLFSAENERLSTAVSALYRACPKMTNILHDQILKVGDVTRRIDRITGNDEENYGGEIEDARGRARIEERLRRVNQKQEDLFSKYKIIQKKLGKLSGRKFSDVEKQFSAETEGLSTEFGEESKSSASNGLRSRLEDLEKLVQDISKEKEDLKENLAKSTVADSGTTQQVPSSYRKVKMDSILKLLERESAMVDSTLERLSRLNLQFQSSTSVGTSA